MEAQQTLVAKIDNIQERLQKAYERMLEQRALANEQTEPDTAAVPMLTASSLASNIFDAFVITAEGLPKL